MGGGGGGGRVGGQDGGHNKINVSVMTPDCQTKFRQFDLKVKMTELIYCVKNILFPLNRILNVDCQKKKKKKKKKKRKKKKRNDIGLRLHNLPLISHFFY